MMIILGKMISLRTLITLQMLIMLGMLIGLLQMFDSALADQPDSLSLPSKSGSGST